MKFSDVVPDRFKGPHHQEFSTWLRKVELAFRVTKTDDIHKTDHLLAYMDPLAILARSNLPLPKVNSHPVKPHGPELDYVNRARRLLHLGATSGSSAQRWLQKLR